MEKCIEVAAQVWVASFFATVSFSGAAISETTRPASDLLLVCTTPDMDWISFCNGYMQASHDILASTGKTCVPDGTTKTDLAELFQHDATVILGADSSMGKISGVLLAISIFENEFPCK